MRKTTIFSLHCCSMEECENLCDRLTILAKGRMQCIGTAQHLKKTYAQGFSVLIKIPETISEGALARLKTRIQEQFENHCILKDEHRVSIFLNVNKSNKTQLLYIACLLNFHMYLVCKIVFKSAMCIRLIFSQ